MAMVIPDESKGDMAAESMGDLDLPLDAPASGSPEPPPLPRGPERADRPRAEQPAKSAIRRLEKSIGIGLPRNKYRIFLGRGIIPPASETKQFVAPLAEINKVRIKVLEGEEDQADKNEFLGEIGISNIRLREDGKSELEIEFSLSATGMLTIRLSDRIGETEGVARYMLHQFRRETAGDIDLNSLPIEELSKKIDLLEQQMLLLKKELEVRRERPQV
jgi:molecular chaperone DnaK (HSP70)